MESNISNTSNIFAIVAPTASGKSTLAINLAQRLNANIFSFDSLSVYKYISIASAKPSKEDLTKIKHYGVDELEPNEHCNAGVFMEIFSLALQESKRNNKGLICVGGSGFYLHSIINGLSKMPKSSQIDSNDLHKVNAQINDLQNPYKFLESIDKASAKSISPNDTYRIYALLGIYFTSGIVPSEYFRAHKSVPIFPNMPIYIIDTPKEELNCRIKMRTELMIQQGLVNEAKWLLAHFGRDIEPFKAIGLKECLQAFEANMDLENNDNLKTLCESIAIHTRQLAKRQRTFNRAKFPNATCLPYKKLEDKILKDFA